MDTSHDCEESDCARFEREPDWCVRCGEKEDGIGWANVCARCDTTMTENA